MPPDRNFVRANMRTPESDISESKNLIRKAVYLQYALGFVFTMMVVSAINTGIARYFPAPLYIFWKWVAGPTTVFAAGLSFKHALEAKYPVGDWGKKVGRFFSFSCLLAAGASFLPMYFPATQIALPHFVGEIDQFLGSRLNPPPPPPQLPQQVSVRDAFTEHWFAPLHWYVRDRDGSLRYYDRAGKDPVTGVELTAVTQEIVYDAERRQDQTNWVQESRNRLAARKQNAVDAENLLVSGDYEQALKACRGVESEFHPDPCQDPYHEAARRKADALVKQSKTEMQDDKLDDAVRDAREAVNLDPGNQSAKTVLALAESLERAIRDRNR